MKLLLESAFEFALEDVFGGCFRKIVFGRCFWKMLFANAFGRCLLGVPWEYACANTLGRYLLNVLLESVFGRCFWVVFFRWEILFGGALGIVFLICDSMEINEHT